jgi:tyrosyl-tRNA synthetase
MAQRLYLRQNFRLFQYLVLMLRDEISGRKIAKDVHLCYVENAKRGLAVHLICLKHGEKFVVIFQEAAELFRRGFVRDQIPEQEFGHRFINGKSLTDLIHSAEDGAIRGSAVDL